MKLKEKGFQLFGLITDKALKSYSKRTPDLPIYYNRIGTGLGDTWAVVNALLSESVRIETPVKLHANAGQNTPSDHSVLVSQILNLLDSPGRIILTLEKPDREIEQGLVWGQPKYFRTRRRWKPSGEPTICYQFDGHSSASDKNPPEQDLERLTSWAPSHRFVKVGLPMGLEESIEALATSDLFIGSCSGLSHVAHSMNLPTIIVQYRMPVEPWHGPKDSFVIAEGTNHAILLGRMMLKQNI